METYNYLENVANDVLTAIRDTYTPEEIAGKLQDTDTFADELHDDLWCNDSVTGNGSGSYTFSTWKAEEYLCHNWDLLSEALNEFGCGVTDIANGAEYCDVTIRCYLLGQAISEALAQLAEEIETKE